MCVYTSQYDYAQKKKERRELLSYNIQMGNHLVRLYDKTMLKAVDYLC